MNTDRRSVKGRTLLRIMESLAELERSTMGERVRAGVAEAKRQGKHCGRPQRMIEAPLIDFSARLRSPRARAMFVDTKALARS